MTYGMPYRGSKNSIAEWVVSQLPPAENFYDLFCGGCAVTHAAILSGKYKNFYLNDLNPMFPQAFMDCLKGKFKDEDRWISHDEFMRLRDSDFYAACCFSFGNNCESYAYSYQIEPIKKAMHHAIIFRDYSLMDALGVNLHTIDCIPTKQERYNAVKNILSESYRHLPKQYYKALMRLQFMESLERITMLNGLYNTDNLHCSNVSYEQVTIKPNSVIYCDPPYRGTRNYRVVGKFDNNRFLTWASAQKGVYISAYGISDNRFSLVSEMEKVSLFRSFNGTRNSNVERLYTIKTCSLIN